MKTIKSLTKKIIKLLKATTSFEKEANWFAEKLNTIKHLNKTDEQYYKELKELQKWLGGMSRFDDWVLVPKKNVKYTFAEMEQLQLQLAEDLDDKIQEELDKKA